MGVIRNSGLRPGPRLRRQGLLQRRHHQDRAGSRDHRLRRLLERHHRIRPRPAGLRLPADHLQDPRPAHRPRHRLAHPAPARQDRTRPPRRPSRLSVEDRRHRPVRPLPAAPAARRHDQTPRDQHQGPPDRDQEHRPGWNTPSLVETRFSPDALVWVAVVFHGTAAWRNHDLIIFRFCFIEHLSSCAVQLPRLVAGSARQAAPGGRGHLLVGHPGFAPRVPRAGRG